MPYSDEQKISNIKYLNKDFSSFKASLIDYAKAYFPNSYKDFNETSPGMMLIELSAYVGDVLSYYIDQQYKEMMLPLVQERRNIINISKMLGYKVKPTIPSYVNLNITQLVNSTTDINNKQPDYSTAAIVDKGLQIQSSLDGDVYFETLEPVDFTVSSSYDNQPKEAAFDNDGIVSKYEISRNVKAISGKTKTKDFTIGSPKQYLNLTLTEKNVIDIIGVVDTNNGNKWYEVEYLAQDKIPEENHYTTTTRNSAYEDIANNYLSLPVPYTLQYIKTGKRFITEVNDDDTTSLIFGNGVLRNGALTDSDFINLDEVGLTIPGQPDASNIGISNIDPRAGDSRMTLGETPGNTTLRVTYRVGGGLRSNVTAGTLTTPTNVASKLLNSGASNLEVTNPTPAIGGGDKETIEEIRHNTKQFFAAQNRCVTKEDYEARVLSMPPRFGSIAKVFANPSGDISWADVNNVIANLDLDTSGGLTQLDIDQLKTNITAASGDVTTPSPLVDDLDKLQSFFDDYAELTGQIGTSAVATIDLNVLGYDINKNLVTLPTGASSSITHPLKQNIKEYLSNYRIITDQINIIDGKIINFGVAFEVVAHRSANKGDVKMRCINKITDYFNIDKMQFRQPIYTSDLEYELMGLEGVRAVNWIQLTQDFAALFGEQLKGFTTATLLWDFNAAFPDAAQNSDTYGWQYDFTSFYNPGSGDYVAKGVILPSVEPAVFELKNPKQNIRGVVV